MIPRTGDRNGRGFHTSIIVGINPVEEKKGSFHLSKVERTKESDVSLREE